MSNEKYIREKHEELVRMVQGAAAMVIALNGGRDIPIVCKDAHEAKVSANDEK